MANPSTDRYSLLFQALHQPVAVVEDVVEIAVVDVAAGVVA